MSRACWLFDEARALPSQRDNMSVEQEADARRATAALMVAAGKKLFDRPVVAAALLFMHWFYCLQSFKRHDRFMVGTAALFLAGKVEECPRKLRDVIQAMQVTMGKPKLDPTTEAFEKLRQKVCLKEKILLQTVEFNLCLELPFSHITRLCSEVSRNGQVPKAEAVTLAHTSNSFAFDCFRSAMCIRYAPVELALCSIYVGSKFCRVALPDGWMASASTLQRVTLKRCEEAVDRLLTMYEVASRRHVRVPVAVSSTPLASSAVGTPLMTPLSSLPDDDVGGALACSGDGDAVGSSDRGGGGAGAGGVAGLGSSVGDDDDMVLSTPSRAAGDGSQPLESTEQSRRGRDSCSPDAKRARRDVQEPVIPPSSD